MRLKSLLMAATGLGLLCAAFPAAAQVTTTAPDTPQNPDAVINRQAGERAASSSTLGEIIVTARKRQESILEVPVVETVLTAQQLDRNQVTNITDVATLTPGLLLGLSSLEVGTQVSIRGVGTTSLDPGIDQSISLNLDGLQVTQGMAYSVGVFDMAQVEILKGPQALFFGKNSPGGVVSIRSADPGADFETMARVGYEAVANEWRGEAVVSGPVSDTLGLRLATMYSDYGGYFRNIGVAPPGLGTVTPPKHFGEAKTLFIRGTALYKPTDAFTARLKLNYTRDRQKGGAGYQLASCPDGLGNYAGVPFYSPREDCRVDRNIGVTYLDSASFGGLRNNGTPFTNITQKFGTLELDYDINPALTITSVTGYYDLKTAVMQNGTIAGASATLIADKDFRRKEFTEEVRVNSDFSGPLNFTAGGFYQDAEMTNDIILAGNTAIGLPPRLAVGTHDVDIKSVSLFGQVRYDVTPDLEVAVGTRWTHEKRENSPTTVDLFGAFSGVPGTVLTPTVPEISSKNWSPELTLTYTPTDDFTLFGSLKQGYKSGSYNLIVPVNPGQDNSFGDEKVRGGEVGVKTRLMDRQVQANLAFYRYKYEGLQVGVNEAAAGGLPVIRTQNAGSAKVYGVDFDLNYRPAAAPGLDIRAAVNWNKAKFSDFRGAACWGGQTIAEGCNLAPNPTTLDPVTGLPLFAAQDLSGSRLTRAPEWQVNLGFNYEVEVAGGKTLSVGLDGQYSSKYLTNLGRRRDFYQDSFAKMNANIALRGRNDAWEVALIANNISDKLTTGSCTNLNYAGGQVLPGTISGGMGRGPAGTDELICTFDRGREVWLRVTVRPSAMR